MDRIRQLEQEYSVVDRQADNLRKSNHALAKKMSDTTILNRRLLQDNQELQAAIRKNDMGSDGLGNELLVRKEELGELRIAY